MSAYMRIDIHAVCLPYVLASDIALPARHNTRISTHTTHTGTHTYTSTYETHTDTHTHTSTYKFHSVTHIHTFVHTRTHTPTHAHIYILLPTRSEVNTHNERGTHIYLHTHIDVYIHFRIYLHTYNHVHIHIQQHERRSTCIQCYSCTYKRKGGGGRYDLGPVGYHCHAMGVLHRLRQPRPGRSDQTASRFGLNARPACGQDPLGSPLRRIAFPRRRSCLRAFWRNVSRFRAGSALASAWGLLPRVTAYACCSAAPSLPLESWLRPLGRSWEGSRRRMN